MDQPADIALVVMDDGARQAPDCDFSMLMTTPVVILIA